MNKKEKEKRRGEEKEEKEKGGSEENLPKETKKRKKGPLQCLHCLVGFSYQKCFLKHCDKYRKQSSKKFAK